MDKNVKRILLSGSIIIAVIVIISLVPGLIWGGRYSDWGMMGHMGGYGAMFFMPVLWIVVLGLIIWGVISATGGSCSDRSEKSVDSALEVLKRRYAEGEISKEEFDAKKKDLV